MRLGFTANHWNDAQGRPEGGTTFGIGFTIGWQHGPLGRGEDRRPPNGAFVEDIIAAAKDRLEFYQLSGFACQENDNAIANLERALWELDQRTRVREARGVEGTHTP
jgi:hypothetical protein